MSASPLEWAAAGAPRAGETESGDASLVVPFAGGMLFAVVDGLGHGPEAARAARRALAVLGEHPHLSVVGLVVRCHVALRSSRGAVLSLASFDAQASTISWVGVGDVQGALHRADSSRAPITLFPRPGVVGLRLPSTLDASVIAVERGDRLVLATDGARVDLHRLSVPAGELASRTASRLLEARNREDDDALVVVARWREDGAPEARSS